ncbi:MAG: Ni/Fe hydrogenase subunit alpha [Actinobacteria bacterium]|nr:Ni/Fe hydrogenase subunit alpha [Actinomycetota bacterium]
MAENINIEVSPVSRVEGHGDLVLDVKDRKVEKLIFRIPESPRFFEAMLVGKNWDEPSHITSRICGICSVAHTYASIKATEAAFGIVPNDMILNLRKLIFHHEIVQSNALHVYFLAAPDLFGVGSVIPLVETHPEVVNIALRVKKMANDMVRIIGGRAVHPIRTVAGGFTKLPAEEEMHIMRDMLRGAYPDLEKSLDVLKTLKIPDFERETEYISLSHPEDYANYDGNIKSTDGWEIRPSEYLTKIKEKVVKHSTAKHCWAERDAYMVGALSRFNNNYEKLSNNAKSYADELGLKAPCYNSYMINIAQFVEIIHSVDDSLRIIEELLDEGMDEERRMVEINPGAGRGVGAVEAPRGLLIHDYTYNEAGRIEKANLIIPTNMNYGNIERDMQKLVPGIIDKTEDEIRLACEMMIRAYDPCISCSTHFLKVRLINK